MWIPNPVAFEIGPFAIRWYGILMSTALALGTFLAYREAEKQKIDPENIINLVVIAAPLGFIGARIYYIVFFNLEYYLSHPAEIPAVWHGGLAIHGALIGGVLGGYLVVRHYKLDFWQMADIVAPSLILGQAIGRWGNFFNQEAYGYETNLPWAMYIDGAYRHPTFLYESLWDLMVFVFLLWLRRKNWIKRGDVFASYFAFYSLGRVFVEHFRTDSLMMGPLRAAQVVSILGMIAGVCFIWYNHRQRVVPAEENLPLKEPPKKRK
ncbi:prolipoprotein diacylglyceryl transferase [Candidatus Formimonas warabiya]|uniref:Phosphatidylglycerol--prolipoprotein diacylglyceryl transferase n=1 Tax=Formimonas warabiya TaxID=1761012 RepID=A0A3G1KWJ0_FORW1|nr:prolipoprotein diacylglyceryl transferase [Candidatus Formimonas warabiya]ATW26903.1 prolipoprotein diacylglyceryl transferase [Candidatus Formimonas warabiya]